MEVDDCDDCGSEADEDELVCANAGQAMRARATAAAHGFVGMDLSFMMMMAV